MASVFIDNRTELIPNALGHVLTPSAVGVADDGSVLVGLPARERLDLHQDLTATAFKRWMGTPRVLSLGRRQFDAVELSAMVLRSLKVDAETFLGTEVDSAVITVPAYFNQMQREATVRAAALAGLRADRLINEPTAAGLAYGLQERKDHTHFLVFDLGGGTFDVSVLGYFEGVVEVRASAGDTRLGGEDFVAVLQQMFFDGCSELSAQQRETMLRVRAVWHAAEQAKRDLTEHEEARMRVVFAGREHVVTVSRQAFEAACQPLLARLRRPIERALGDARIAPGELDEIVLVGGATRMPMIRHLVTRLFQRLPLRAINPDEAIARGAAIQAALMDRNASLEEIVLTDVMPYSLGIVISERVGGREITDRFSPIIERNSPVPVSRVASYCTTRDQQAAIRLDIRQGESPVGSENLFLGDLEIVVPQRPAGEVTVDVRFSYDASGLLAVDVEDKVGGRKANKVILQSADTFSDGKMAEVLARLDALKVHPRDEQENVYLVARLKRLYEDHLGDTRQALQQWLAEFELALDTQEPRTIELARTTLRSRLDAMGNGFIL
ncbi:Hsp70 family protein [Methyloversatilis universalis]|uniref:Hsp70 family protein n=1 Tax=Methyloversatilis universalis TaxID=378211 RepID=UPI001E380106|nr:Hsp70 family protein [Methyloversatilis universalis]